MSAATLNPVDAALAISNSGCSRAVVQAIEIAKSFGGKTVAMPRPGVPLAEVASIVIPMMVTEDGHVLLPTPSRYAHMAAIDTLAAGVAARVGERSLEALRRIRYTVASLGIAIPTLSSRPAPLMNLSSP